MIWTRLGPSPKPRLTREAIVETAVALADTEGIEAVSIRRVAARLDVRPMSLYTHIQSKDDLLDLMCDRISAEVVLPEPLPDDWRDALRAIAQRTRAGCLRHPWVLVVRPGRPRIGPNSLRHLEQSSAAVAGLPLPPSRRISILRTVDTYTVGHVTAELSARQECGQPSSGDAEWQARLGDYFQGLLGSGGYPLLAEFSVADLVLVGENAEASFTDGLEWLLAGIAVEIDAVRAGSGRPPAAPESTGT